MNPNCECQCHFPPTVICPITHCCHCISNNMPLPYNANNFSPFSSSSSFYQSGKETNMNFMNSHSTNFRSNNDSIRFKNSEDNIKGDYFLKKTRNNQNQLGRNFSEPNIHINRNQNVDNSQIQEQQNITVFY